MNSSVNSSTDVKFEIVLIRRDLDALLLLYKKLAEKMISYDEPLPDEKAALESDDEYLGKDEIDAALR